MTEPKDTGIPGLAALAGRYRQQTAPPGFSARVMAGIEMPVQRPWPWQPRWALAIAVLLIAVISLPLLRDARTPPPMARIGVDTQVLASAANLLAQSERSTPTSISDIPNVMSVQSLADIPDPIS